MPKEKLLYSNVVKRDTKFNPLVWREKPLPPGVERIILRLERPSTGEVFYIPATAPLETRPPSST